MLGSGLFRPEAWRWRTVVKISEFAEMNRVTTKMLRHYDEIGLLKPSAIDPMTGYRFYDEEQGGLLHWILVLKNLEFSLAEIKAVLAGPVRSEDLANQLKGKRIEITSQMNVQLQKKYQIDRLITTLEQEEIVIGEPIELLKMAQQSIHELKKNMPNLEVFLESATALLSACADSDPVAVMRFDIRHFKHVNDVYGFDAGDQVIVACYEIIKESLASYRERACLGRAHGDEFIIFVQAGREELYSIAQSIVKEMESYDFAGIGCPEQLGCRVGFLYTEKRLVDDIRKLIENTIETIYSAAATGCKYSVFAKAYAG